MNRTNGIPGWIVVDPDLHEACMVFETRKEAREAAGDWGRVQREIETLNTSLERHDGLDAPLNEAGA